MMASTLPLICYSMYFTTRYLANERVSPAMYTALGLIGIVCVGLQLAKLLKQRHKERLGLDCERAVGQELNQLMLDGCRVYHDFMAEEFNIDHIVIGTNGVFAIETKGRAKSTKGKGPDDVKVIYDGQMLQFPTWREQKPIEQAKRQATWLSNWLTSAVGEKIPVTPVLALAGWFIERKQKGLLIYNGKNPSFLAKMPTESPFSPEMTQRIAHQIEQRCRNVAPQAYRKEKSS
ncbi:MAG: nuclease-related domain-containing protein [Desulfobulbaceae bacterium]|nr:nuclease-related domain-containing protein [Desulfobulbaceae bacterium]